MYLMLIQCLRVGEELYLTSKFTKNAILGCVLLAKYISAPITLRYDNSGLSNSSLSSRGLKGSFFTSSDRTTIGVRNGYVLSI